MLDTPSLLQNARIAVKQGNYQEAITFYTQYIENVPKDAYALYERASCYELVGNVRGAIDDYIQCMEAGGIPGHIRQRIETPIPTNHVNA